MIYDHNIQLMANAVVIQAMEDYRDALVKQHKYERFDNKNYKEWSDKVCELERYFASDDITLYTKLDCADLGRKVKAEVVEFDYDLKALNKSHQK